MNTPRTRARRAICAAYGLTGFISAIWGSSLAAVDARLHLGPAAVGAVLMVVAASALVVMPVAGLLADRVPPTLLVRVTLPGSAVAVVGPALAGSLPSLLLFAAILGGVFGVLNVSLSVSAVAVERAGGAVMSTAHAIWTLGAVAGGAVVSAGLAVGIEIAAVMTGAAAVAAGVALAASPVLGRCLPGMPGVATADTSPQNSPRLRFATIVALGAIGAAAFVSEGAAADWASIHATTVLGADPSTGSLVFTLFFAAMTVVRLCGDTVRSRFGPRRTIAVCGFVAMLGYVFVLGSPLFGASIALAALGWALVGGGMAVVWPIVASSVGAVTTSARQLSLVTAISYGGGLAGPGAIGLIAGGSNLSAALVLPAALAALVAVAAPRILTVLAAARQPDHPTPYEGATNEHTLHD